MDFGETVAGRRTRFGCSFRERLLKFETSLLSNYPNVRRFFLARGASPLMRERRINRD
jgi:hypothetical protein